MNEAFVMSRAAAKKLRLEQAVLLPYAYRGEEIARYSNVNPDALVIYPYREREDGTPELIPAQQLAKDCPNVFEYLSSFKNKLKLRQDSRRLYADGVDWYRHLRPGTFHYIRSPKLVFKAISKKTCGGLLGENTAFDGANCPAIIAENIGNHDIKYLLGLLNSTLASYHLRGVCPPKLSGYLKFSATCLSDTPIRTIDFAKPSDKEYHDKIVSLVDQLLTLSEQLPNAKTDHEKTTLQRQIDAVDLQIDQLVYELYVLTEKEIKIIEGKQ